MKTSTAQTFEKHYSMPHILVLDLEGTLSTRLLAAYKHGITLVEHPLCGSFLRSQPRLKYVVMASGLMHRSAL